MAAYSNRELYDALKELEIIDQVQLNKALKDTRRQKTPLEKILLDHDLISDADLGRLISDLVSLPLVRLSQISIPDEVLKIIPEVVAKSQKVISFQKDKKGLHLALNDPSNKQIISFIEKKAGIPAVVYYATEREIINAFVLYKKDVKKAFGEIIAENVEAAKGKAAVEPPIIKIVDTLISYAYENKASDIHTEPSRNHSLVRFRIDGVLHDIVKLPLKLHSRIVTRVKIMARLRTDEHQAAQDGKIVYKTEYEDLDVRVSIVPVTDGEKVVMRLLSERSRQFSLHDLGLSDLDNEKVQQAYEKPYGMILATGPTGCGKTTTLYAISKLLNRPDVNIMTIEDPVEYDIEGVNQIQVNPKTGLTFATGLRSIVRQDPNIIFVGEIRDEETAGIAINSAMTGHLVLSTMHTNDAATTIPRLFDMGIEPFLVASTVNVIVAQRLVRKICQKCRVSTEAKLVELQKHLTKELVEKHFGGRKQVRVYHGKGCPICHQTGYEGRIGVFEVMVVDDTIRGSIVDRKDAETIKEIAVKLGMTTMVEDGIEKVKQGITTIEEVIRVIKE